MSNRSVHETATLFETLAESAPDAIFTIDADSTILFANAATERVFGYTPDQLIGKPLRELIPQRLRGRHEHGMSRYIRTGKRHVSWTGLEVPGLHKDGHEVALEVSFGEFIDEEGRRIFSGFMRDVSERVRAREELERARQTAESALGELAAVGRIMNLALASGTYEGMMQRLLHGLRQELSVDEATVLLLDQGTNELVVQMADGIPLAKNVRIPLGSGLAGRVAASGKPVVVDDLSKTEVLNPVLRREIKSLAAVPLRVDGTLIGALHVGTRKSHAFHEGDVRLLEIVGERMAGVLARTRLFQENEKRRVDAETATRLRDEVLSVVSHDLRNPVSTVAMAASLLADPEIHLTPEQRAKQLQIISRSAARMNRLISDLLDVARIEQGHLAIRCREEDPRSIVSEATESFRTVAAEKGVALQCDAERGLPRVKADRDRMIQALSNLINNAIKFSSPGGRVTVRSFSVDGTVRFEVSDTGSGIAASDLPHVFERFWQAKKTAHMGSGLGLAIVKGIVDAHGGRVHVDSEPGRGSTFLIELDFA